jgi:hypothetical protein
MSKATHEIFHKENVSPASEARRLRFEYNRLQRRIITLYGVNISDSESNALRNRVDQIARDLGSIQADTMGAVESKLKVALDLVDGRIDKTSHRLFASALSDLHYLALLSEPRTK